MPLLTEIVVADSPDSWRAGGFFVVDGRCQIGHVVVRFDESLGKGVTSWSFDSAAGGGDVDGLVTNVTPGANTLGAHAPGEHANGAEIIDHIVVLTPDLPRTLAALDAFGLRLLNSRDTESYGAPMRQAFCKSGEVILEIVGPQTPDPSGKPARFFGLAVTVTSLDDAAHMLGEKLGTVKPAVQQGRSIATLRAGQTVPIVLMSR